MTRVMIADDHPLVLSGVESILRDSEFEVVGRASDGTSVLDALSSVRPDILVLDVSMPQMSGMDVLRTMRARGDQRPIILLTASLADHCLVEALSLNVDGILLKEGAEHLLVRCLREVCQGKRWIDREAMDRALSYTMNDGKKGQHPLACLTKRERAVTGLIARGMRNRAIAAELGVTEGTVKVYLHRIYEKLNVQSRTELALLASSAPEIE